MRCADSVTQQGQCGLRPARSVASLSNPSRPNQHKPFVNYLGTIVGARVGFPVPASQESDTSMQPIGPRAACLAAAATVVAITAIVGALNSFPAAAGESVMRVALQSDQAAPLAQMKAEYRRPATIP